MTNPKVFTVILFLTALVISGCSNTVDGAGRDLEGAGEWVQETF